MDQFEPVEGGYLYRRYMKGEAYQVTLDERDDFVEQFNRRLRYAVWTIFPTTLLLIVGLVVIGPEQDRASGQLFMWVGLVLVIAPYWAIFRWAWNEPLRRLASRSPAAAARTQQEVQRIKFEKLSYQQLGFAVGAALLLVLKVSSREDVLHGWGRIWLIAAAVIILAAGVQAFRKWRFERTHAD